MHTSRLNILSLQAAIATSNKLSLTGELKVIEAGEGEKKQLKLQIEAYTGDPMIPNGFDLPVIVDLRGAKFGSSSTPIIRDHDTKRRVGHTTSQRIDTVTHKILAEGLVSSLSQDAKDFADDAQSGFPFQVSIGATIKKGYMLEAGQQAFINGRKVVGPLIIAEQSIIRELSVLVLGADATTSVKIAASTEDIMDFTTFLASLGLEESSLNDVQKTALLAKFEASKGSGTITFGKSTTVTPPVTTPTTAPIDLTAANKAAAENQRRIDRINSLATEFNANYSGLQIQAGDVKITLNDYKTNAIEKNISAEEFELNCSRASRTFVPSTTNSPAIHVAATLAALPNEAIACAIVRQSGKMPSSKTIQATGETWGYEESYDEKVLEASDHRNLRNMSLHSLFNLCITAATGSPFIGNTRSDEFLRATRKALTTLKASGSGMTSMDLTQIFEDVANKMLLTGYNLVNPTWNQWCGVVSVNDFKTHNMYRMTTTGGYQQVGPDGVLKHGGFDDDKYSISANTYGKIVGLTRQHLINDDLGAFNTIMMSLGQDGAAAIEELAYDYLLTNRDTIYASGNKNLISGGGSVLGIAGIEALETLFMNQVNADNAPINLMADRILVGTALRVTAGQLYKQGTIQAPATNGGFIDNPQQGKYAPIVSGYLNNTNLKKRINGLGTSFSNQSATQWFMFGNPSSPLGATVNVAFLNGRQVPIVEQSDAQFDMLGTQFRSYHDIGAGSGDPKLSGRSAGA